MQIRGKFLAETLIRILNTLQLTRKHAPTHTYDFLPHRHIREYLANSDDLKDVKSILYRNPFKYPK